MNNGDRPVRNPFVVLREEFDDWAVLFNPDASLGFAGFGLNPTGVFVWKLLDGEHTLDALVEEIHNHVDYVLEEASDHVRMFIDALVAEGLAAYGSMGLTGKNPPPFPVRNQAREMDPFTYEPPRLVNLSSGQTALGDCAGTGSHGGSCCGGSTASYKCNSGTCFGYCVNGDSDGTCCSIGSSGPCVTCGASDNCSGKGSMCGQSCCNGPTPVYCYNGQCPYYCNSSPCYCNAGQSTG